MVELSLLTQSNKKDGSKLWQKDLLTGIIAPPITYTVDGEQYLTVAVGWGGIVGLTRKFTKNVHPGRIFTFKLGGNGAMPAEMVNPVVASLTTLLNSA